MDEIAPLQIQIGVEEGANIYNLGTGLGTSVKSFLEKYSQVVKDQEIVIRPRQEGDLPFSILNPSSFQLHTKWRPCRDIVDMISTSINLR